MSENDSAVFQLLEIFVDYAEHRRHYSLREKKAHAELIERIANESNIRGLFHEHPVPAFTAVVFLGIDLIRGAYSVTGIYREYLDIFEEILEDRPALKDRWQAFLHKHPPK